MSAIKPSRLTVFIFGVIGLIICFPGALTVARGQLDGVVSLLAGAFVAIGPIARFRVLWDADTLIYRGLLRTDIVRFSELKKFDVSGPDPGNRLGPTLGLRIFTKSSERPVMTVNIKPFSRRDVATLVAMLNEALLHEGSERRR